MALQKVEQLTGQPSGKAQHSPEAMVEAWKRLVGKDAVVRVQCEPGRRATIKVLCSMLQCVEAACEEQGAKAGTVFAVIEGWNKPTLEGGAIWPGGEPVSYEVEPLVR